MNIVIIKYNAGNTRSVTCALNRLGIKPIITDNLSLISQADKVIFPGVGQANSAMEYCRQKGLNDLLPNLKQPVLGICLGLQLFCQYSEEENTPCLNIFDIKIKKFKVNYKIPQIGWNRIFNLKSNLFKGVQENNHVYFVHSYYAPLSPYTISETNYGLNFSSALKKDNFYAVQFHPEKSSFPGHTIIKNFIEYC